MNPFYAVFARVYQKIMWIATLAMRFRVPETFAKEGCLSELPDFIKSHEPNVKKLLVVTDKGLVSAGLLEPMLASLKENGLDYALFDGVVPNPTVQNVQSAVDVYNANSCDGIVAFGGGSSMDCAKGVGARLARPNKALAKMRGVLKVGKKIPILFAVPTTSGTGSETTVAAIISDGNYKYSIMDPVLIPKYALLDPLVTVGLPKHITSTTGMDALSHAVEAFVGINNNKMTREYALRATKAIYDNLEKAYDNGSDKQVRNNMQVAAYDAGIAFTRTNVGAIHAIAHALGGQYHLPHGLAIAITMPHVLRWYGKKAHKSLARLADELGLGGQTREEKANSFIAWIDSLNEHMEIPKTINGNVSLRGEEVNVKEEDIPQMVKNAYKEACPLYPVPRQLTKKDFEKLFREVAGL